MRTTAHICFSNATAEVMECRTDFAALLKHVNRYEIHARYREHLRQKKVYIPPIFE